MSGQILRNSANVHNQDTGVMEGYVNPVTGRVESLAEGTAAGAFADLILHRAGNLTTGTGADLVFSGAGGAGAGKLNTGVDIRIPAGTLVAGSSILKFSLHARRTGTDTSYLDVRFGTTNGTADGIMASAAQFSAGVNPGDITMEVVASATAARLTSTNQISIVNAAGTGVTITELAGLNFAVDNFITVVVAGCTTGSYRVVSWDLQVFQ